MKRLVVEHIKIVHEEPDYLITADNTQEKLFTKLQALKPTHYQIFVLEKKVLHVSNSTITS